MLEGIERVCAKAAVARLLRVPRSASTAISSTTLLSPLHTEYASIDAFL